MTVKELMSYLQSLPPEEEVTVRDRQGNTYLIKDIHDAELYLERLCAG